MPPSLIVLFTISFILNIYFYANSKLMLSTATQQKKMQCFTRGELILAYKTTMPEFLCNKYFGFR